MSISYEVIKKKKNTLYSKYKFEKNIRIRKNVNVFEYLTRLNTDYSIIRCNPLWAVQNFHDKGTCKSDNAVINILECIFDSLGKLKWYSVFEELLLFSAVFRHDPLYKISAYIELSVFKNLFTSRYCSLDTDVIDWLFRKISTMYRLFSIWAHDLQTKISVYNIETSEYRKKSYRSTLPLFGWFYWFCVFLL